MALIEIPDAPRYGLEQGSVGFTMGLRRIPVIRVEGEEQIGLFVGEITDLKLFHLGLDRLLIRQHHRNDDQRPAGVGNPGNPKIHLRQCPRRQEPHHQVIHDLQRELACGDEQESGHDHLNPRRLGAQAEPKAQENKGGGENNQTGEIHRRVMTISPLHGTETKCLTALQAASQIFSFFADQVSSDVMRLFIPAGIAPGPGCHFEGEPGDLVLGPAGTAVEVLNRPAIAVAR